MLLALVLKYLRYITLSIPFRMLPIEELRAAVAEKKVFQFLLGCYRRGRRSVGATTPRLSIPFRMLQVGEVERKRIDENLFQFLLGCYRSWSAASS